MSHQQKTFLRKNYESIIGRSISDRQWQRIIHEYLQADVEELSLLPYVVIYAQMRLESPQSPIDFEAVMQRKAILQGFPIEGGSGEDLMFQIQRRFCDKKGRSPSPQTIYAWGYKIGVPIYKHRFYTSEEVWKWIKHVCSQSRWKFNSNHQSLKAA